MNYSPNKKYVPENNRQNNKKSGGSGLLGLVVLGLFVLSSRLDNDQFPISFILLVGVFVAFIVYAAVVATKKNKAKTGAGSAAQMRTASPAAARPAPALTPRGAEQTEEAVRCHHSTGREKYLEQLDSFLANGIIDKAEYKMMKERYNKLNIEDDYH